MTKELNILFIEDSPDDVELLLFELREGGIEPEWKRIDTADSLKKALLKQEWDIIISDYAMPGFTGLEALSIVKQQEIFTPFIIVSGTIGEETAVATMRAGASDYLMKTKLARLVPAIERELREAENRKKSKKEKEKFITDLMEREEKYRTLTQNLNVGVYRSTPGENGIFVEVNPAFLKIFEFRSKDELESYKAVDFYSNPLDRNNIEEKLLSKEFLINEEVKLRKKDGTRFSASISATAAKDESGKIIHYDGIIEDVTEEKQVREEILTYQSNLKSLANELVVTEEEAKRSYAITLHDTIGQLLIALKYKISELNRKIEKSEHKKLISETSNILQDAINETRNITYELSPPVLYELGLVSAISWKLDEIEKSNKIKTSLTDQSKSYDLDEKEQIIIYRSINELLQNVIKHSKAESVNVSFKLLPNNFRITIKDNGVGFNLDATKAKAISQKKFGLFSIMERIRYFGGELNINAVPDIGTEAVINLPIKTK
jgi:two-component system sensor histidine kinase UhpB